MDNLLTPEEIKTVIIRGQFTKNELSQNNCQVCSHRISEVQDKKTAEAKDKEHVEWVNKFMASHQNEIATYQNEFNRLRNELDGLNRAKMAEVNFYQSELAKLRDLHNGEIAGIAKRIFGEFESFLEEACRDYDGFWIVNTEKYDELKAKYTGKKE